MDEKWKTESQELQLREVQLVESGNKILEFVVKARRSVYFDDDDDMEVESDVGGS